MKVSKLCIIGTGAWANAMHLPVMRKLQHEGLVEYVAVCDLDQTAAMAFGAQLGIETACSDADQMLREVDCDGVVLLLPPAGMPQAIRLAVRYGKPFLCEKPPSTDTSTHCELIEEVGDLPHLVAYNRRHSPFITKACEWLQGQELVSLTTHFSRYRRSDKDFTTTAVHAIDTARCLGGDIGEYRVETQRCAGVVNYYVNGWFVNGARFDILLTPWTASAEEHYIVRGVERTVFVAFPTPGVFDGDGCVEYRSDNRVIQRLRAGDFGIAADDWPRLAGIDAEHRSFLKVLENGTVAESNLVTTLQTQEIRAALRAALSRECAGS